MHSKSYLTCPPPGKSNAKTWRGFFFRSWKKEKTNKVLGSFPVKNYCLLPYISRISLVFSYRQLDLKSNDEHCNGKYCWNSTNGYPYTSTTCQIQQADQGSRTTVYAKSAKECLHYTIFMLLKVCLILTSLDGVVMRRYKKDFSAGPSAGSDSRPLTLFSSFEL